MDWPGNGPRWRAAVQARWAAQVAARRAYELELLRIEREHAPLIREAGAADLQNRIPPAANRPAHEEV